MARRELTPTTTKRRELSTTPIKNETKAEKTARLAVEFTKKVGGAPEFLKGAGGMIWDGAKWVAKKAVSPVIAPFDAKKALEYGNLGTSGLDMASKVLGLQSAAGLIGQTIALPEMLKNTGKQFGQWMRGETVENIAPPKLWTNMESMAYSQPLLGATRMAGEGLGAGIEKTGEAGIAIASGDMDKARQLVEQQKQATQKAMIGGLGVASNLAGANAAMGPLGITPDLAGAIALPVAGAVTAGGIMEGKTPAEALGGGAVAGAGVYSMARIPSYIKEQVKKGEPIFNTKWGSKAQTREELDFEINKNWDKLHKVPSKDIQTMARLKKYRKNVSNGILTIVDNKDSLEMTTPDGKVVGLSPSKWNELNGFEGADQTLKKTFDIYHSISQQAKGNGITVDLMPLRQKLVDLNKFGGKQQNKNSIKFI